MVSCTLRPWWGAPLLDRGIEYGLVGNEDMDPGRGRLRDEGRPSVDGRGELVLESDPLVRESELSEEPFGPKSEGVRGRSASTDAWRGMRPMEVWRRKGGCSNALLVVDVDESRDRSVMIGDSTGATAGVFAPVPFDEREGDPEGVDAAPIRGELSWVIDDDGEAAGYVE